jgi:hypothetical protein
LEGAYFLSVVPILFVVDGIGEEVSTVIGGVVQVDVDKAQFVVVTLDYGLDEFAAEILIGVIVAHLSIFIGRAIGLVVFVATGRGEVHVEAKFAGEKER